MVLVEEFALESMFKVLSDPGAHISRQFAIGHVLLHLFYLQKKWFARIEQKVAVMIQSSQSGVKIECTFLQDLYMLSKTKLAICIV